MEIKSPAAIVEIAARPQPDFDRDVIIPLQKARDEAAAAAEAAAQADLQATANRMQPPGTYGNGYAWHQCTWYVASRIPLPAWMGNATNWSYALSAAGWRSGPPRRGAVGVSHAGWAGHVVVVEGVVGDYVHISEYNWIPYTFGERYVWAGYFQYFY